MTSTRIYHYVYRITNVLENKHYYGKRSSNIAPNADLGIKYFSSSKDKSFILQQKQFPQQFKYKIIRQFSNSIDAILFESVLHKKFNVADHTQFYNKVLQTPNGRGFDSTGKVSAKDIHGKFCMVSINDPRYISGELVGVTKGHKLSETRKNAISKVHKGKQFSKEHIKKLSDASIGRTKSKTHKDSLRKMRQSQIWIHNPNTNQSTSIYKTDAIPDGWVCGRSRGSCSGLRWIYNLLTNERTMIEKYDVLPIGYAYGRGDTFKKIF